MQNESWGETKNNESSLRKGGSSRRATGRTKAMHEREANLQKLAESYYKLGPHDYITRMIALRRDEIY